MFTLAPEALEAGYRLEGFDAVGSTNALGLERAAAGERGPLWLAALQQTSGRGRRGRDWASPHGNLAASLLLANDLDPAIAASLGFVAGLSLSDALEMAAPELRMRMAPDYAQDENARPLFQLKWPNDVLADGAKLSGILLESSILQDGRFAVVIGIGVNVVAAPEGLPYPASSLAALGSSLKAEELFEMLSACWVQNYRLWDKGQGLPAIRDRWLEKAAGLGSDVAVRVDGRVVRGVFETIDESCRFVIRENDGTRTRIAAGDVHFGAVASVRQ